MENYLQEFLRNLGATKGRSELTLRHYQFYLERFLGFTKITQPAELSLGQVERYRRWLDQQTDKLGKPLSPTTKDYHLIALRSFIKYLNQRGLINLNRKKIWLANGPRRRPAPLKKSELEKLLAAPLETAVRSFSLTQLRDKAILETLFGSGLKVSALTALKKNQELNLTQQARYWLKQYLGARRDQNLYLFVSHDRAAPSRTAHQPLTPRSVERLVEKYKKLAGIVQKVSPETLRRR